MNREQKAAAIEEVAGQIQESEAVFAVDYRGISVPQAAELRTRLTEAGARFRVVKNTLTMRAADQAGAESLKEVLEGPTAFTFVLADGGDVALAAKALATFRREHDVVAFKGGLMNGDPLTVEQLEALSRLPARDVLHGQLVGMIASPITGLVRGLNALISGLVIQLGKIRDQGLVGGDAPAEEAPAEEAAAEAPADEGPADEAPAEEAAAEAPAEEAPADEAPAEEAAEAPAESGEDATAESASAKDAAEAPAEEAAEQVPAESGESASAESASAEDSAEAPADDEAPAEDAAAEESAGAGAEEASAEEASAEADGTESDATDAPSEGDEKE